MNETKSHFGWIERVFSLNPSSRGRFSGNLWLLAFNAWIFKKLFFSFCKTSTPFSVFLKSKKFDSNLPLNIKRKEIEKKWLICELCCPWFREPNRQDYDLRWELPLRDQPSVTHVKVGSLCSCQPRIYPHTHMYILYIY